MSRAVPGIHLNRLPGGPPFRTDAGSFAATAWRCHLHCTGRQFQRTLIWPGSQNLDRSPGAGTTCVAPRVGPALCGILGLLGRGLQFGILVGELFELRRQQDSLLVELADESVSEIELHASPP